MKIIIDCLDMSLIGQVYCLYVLHVLHICASYMCFMCLICPWTHRWPAGPCCSIIDERLIVINRSTIDKGVKDKSNLQARDYLSIKLFLPSSGERRRGAAKGSGAGLGGAGLGGAQQGGAGRRRRLNASEQNEVFGA